MLMENKNMLVITLKHKTGLTLREAVNYIHFEDGTISYACNGNPHPVALDIVKVPTAVLESLDIEGWKDISPDKAYKCIKPKHTK
jgi:hypothetical protein